MPTDALAQSRTFYGVDGRVTGRSATDSGGSTTFYDASGRIAGIEVIADPDRLARLEFAVLDG